MPNTLEDHQPPHYPNTASVQYFRATNQPPVWAKLFSETNLAAQPNFSAKKGIDHLLQPPTAAVISTNLQIKMENRGGRHKSISNHLIHLPPVCDKTQNCNKTAQSETLNRLKQKLVWDKTVNMLCHNGPYVQHIWKPITLLVTPYPLPPNYWPVGTFQTIYMGTMYLSRLCGPPQSCKIWGISQNLLRVKSLTFCNSGPPEHIGLQNVAGGEARCGYMQWVGPGAVWYSVGPGAGAGQTYIWS